MYLLGNKADMLESRRVSDEDHRRFVRLHELQGGVVVSARSGDTVVRTFFELAGRAAGYPLSEHELAFHDAVVEAHVLKGRDDDAAKESDDAEVLRIAQEDADADRRRANAIAAAAAQKGDPGPSCCVIA
jgi:hypothetical protein